MKVGLARKLCIGIPDKMEVAVTAIDEQKAR